MNALPTDGLVEMAQAIRATTSKLRAEVESRYGITTRPSLTVIEGGGERWPTPGDTSIEAIVAATERMRERRDPDYRRRHLRPID
jgi:hypothetical protein